MRIINVGWFVLKINDKIYLIINSWMVVWILVMIIFFLSFIWKDFDKKRVIKIKMIVKISESEFIERFF